MNTLMTAMVWILVGVSAIATAKADTVITFDDSEGTIVITYDLTTSKN